jgi:ubiquinone/menaquinone biosynthesis C-methylase UbiE
MMDGVAKFQEHWLSIDPERLARYETMFEWSTAAEAFYAPADIGSGQIVADFGCGPGHTAIEFARRVGSSGHVHALDINAEFVRRTRARAQASGFVDRVTAHLLDSDRLPLADAALDRITARNTIVYVADALATFKEFRRVLKPGGLAHVIEGDWHLTAVEPLGEHWSALVEAAMWAWPASNIGRRLYGLARQAGFTTVTLQVVTAPDTKGRLLGMIRSVAGYARDSGSLDEARIDAALETVEQSVATGTYLAIVPQFLVTATN